MRANSSWRDAVTGTAAGLVGMVPEGLVLLTSIAFGLTAVTLARRKVLVQELPAVEVLARVDVVCLDKTGTLTEGEIDLASCELVDPSSRHAVDVSGALGVLATEPSPNATMLALRRAHQAPDDWAREHTVPFSSARKWSAVTVADRGTWVLGAPEMLLADGGEVRTRADAIATTGQRVLVLAHTDQPVTDGPPLPELDAVALVRFDERIRGDAGDTLRYFADQGVHLKIISGDNPRTVGAVAARVGLPGADHVVDARGLPAPDDADRLALAVEQGVVFGRVTPQQKRAMVGALQSRGHVVAMTGDGVNDALAPRPPAPSRSSCSSTAASRTCRPWWPKGDASSPTSSASPTCSSSRTCTPRSCRWRRRSSRCPTRSCRATSRSSPRSRSASRRSSSRWRRTPPATDAASCGGC
jgi:cation-transporting ATPase E